MTQSLTEAIQEEFQRYIHLDDDKIVESAVKAIHRKKLDDEAVEWAAKFYVQQLRSANRRQVQRAAAEELGEARRTSQRTRKVPGVEKIVMGPNLIEMLRTKVPLYDGRPPIPFADMTVIDHQYRIERLSSEVSGIHDTISIHQDAIDLLKASNCETLREWKEAQK